MKTFTKVMSVVLCVLLAISPAMGQSQLSNSGFESWETVSSGEEPVNWSSFLEATGSMASMVKAVQLEKSTDSHTGTYSAKIYARSVAGIATAQGNLTTGQINGGSMTATDATGNYNYTNESTGHAMRFAGRPDTLKVWLKGATAQNVKISAYLHTKGYYQDPNSAGANVELVAEAAAAPAALVAANGWQQYIIPFTYHSAKNPYYALVSFATCNVAGQGAESDYMFIDDVEMVYNSKLISATYNGSAVVFEGTSATVDVAYSPKMMAVTTDGAGTDVEYDFNETSYLLTIIVKGGDFADNPTNFHTYTIQFAGMASNNDDEPNAVIHPETTFVPQEWAVGTFYLMNASTGTYLQNNSTLSSSVHEWTISGEDPYTIKDATNKALSLTRSKSSRTFSAANFSVKSDAANPTDFSVSGSVAGYQISTEIKYYDGLAGIGAKTAPIYFAGNGAGLTCELTATAASQWKLIDPKQYNRVNNFWPSYASATFTNGVSASDFIYDGQSVTNLPLGIYSITGGGTVTVAGNAYTAASGKFYIPEDAEVSFAGVINLTYFGRLDLSLNGSYNGVAMTDGHCNTVYVPGHDEEYLQINYANGATAYLASFDKDTYTLTINVQGVGRSRETEVVFNAPNPTLAAQYMGQDIAAGDNIDEEFDENELSVSLGAGVANYNAVINHETGVLTITLIDVYGDETAYTINFLPTTPAVVPGSGVDYDSDIVCTFAGLDVDGTYAHVDWLVNGNISFSLMNVGITDGIDLYPLGDITAQNIAINEDGRFFFSGNRRIGEDIMDLGKVPFTVSGQIKEGVLYASATIDLGEDMVVDFKSHLTPVSSQDYTDELVVRVNGVASPASNSTISVGTLGNGNINFLLKNFSLGELAVGNISIENLEQTEDGCFAYNGSIFIAAGDDPDVASWSGPDLGAIDLEMRGQIKNGYLAVVINIDLPGQLVHVTFGCQNIDSTIYPEDLVVTVNGVSNASQVANVDVATIHNGNINFSLKNFALGELQVGNITIENLQMDANGNFSYAGNISIAPGDDPFVLSWNGPSLGLLPMNMSGQIKNGHIVATINLNLPGQYVHVALGTTPVSTQNFTSDLVVSVNGVANAPQEATIEVGTLNNDNINFLLKNFSLGDLHVGNISIDNLALDAKGNFAYNDVIFIAPGDDPSVDSWAGPALGMIEIDLKGKMANDGLTVVINISIPEQDVHVTFGMTPESTRTFVRNVIVTIAGEDPVTQQGANIVVGQLKNGNINFILQDFYLDDMAVGSIAIENLEVAADSTFAFNDYMTISNGSTGEGWAGPAMGALLLNMTGVLDSRTNDTLSVHIDIDLTASLGYTVAVDLDNTKYTRTVTNGNFGTICLPYAVAADAYSGATIYSVAGTYMEGGNVAGIVVEEEIGALVAGKPYIFKATADKFVATMSGARTNDVVEATALVGNLGPKEEVPVGSYILKNNQLCVVNTAGVTVGTNRAYINLDGVSEAETGARRIVLGVDGANIATSLEDADAAATIDWTKPVYNVLGQQVGEGAVGVLIQNGVKFIAR